MVSVDREYTPVEWQPPDFGNPPMLMGRLVVFIEASPLGNVGADNVIFGQFDDEPSPIIVDGTECRSPTV